MLQSDLLDFYDRDALLERLTNGMATSDRQVVFVVGSALTSPHAPGHRGVPGVDGVIELIASEFNERQRSELLSKLEVAENKYQDAFKFLLGRRSPQAANDIVRRAVASARRDSVARGSGYTLNGSTSEDACRAFESDIAGWFLNPGVSALGELMAGYPERFGKIVLTTNFDPLIGISIAAAGGISFRTFLHGDGNLAHTQGDGAHIVHLHGYWFGSDTLHTGRQLGQQRPQLRSSLAHLLRNKIVVIMAYGGWDDVFTKTLVDVVIDDNAYPEIIWCFRDTSPSMRPKLFELLKPGIDRGRVSLYAGIDCHSFLPQLYDSWLSIEGKSPRRRQPQLSVEAFDSSVIDQPDTGASIEAEKKHTSKFLCSLEEDRPPVIDFLVGRDADLKDLEAKSYRVAFVTGIGGQGKSALVSKFFSSDSTISDFDHRVWLDCKEQSERFEDHLAHLIESLNDGRAMSAELSKQPAEDLADLFCSLTADFRILIIFDNVDHYIDLERLALTGAARLFVERFLSKESKAKLVFTCRPDVDEADLRFYIKKLAGIDLVATRRLFDLRGAKASDASLERAFNVTGGHPLWLDLLAAQVAQRIPPIELDELLENISAGTGEIPDATLRSIWTSLKDREQIVLQGLAETLRPTTAIQLSDYLRSRTNFKQISKALKTLRSLNLLVTKELDEGEGFELHPVIRAFIKNTFKRSERVWYIDAILSMYSAFFGTHLKDLKHHPSSSMVRHWLEGAELCINAGHNSQALLRLSEVKGVFHSSEPPGEYIRVTQILLSTLPVSEWQSHKHFDDVFKDYHRCLVNMGRVEEAVSALEQYEKSLAGKDARYINYCDMQTYMNWMAGNFIPAIRWGTEGSELKNTSGVDTPFNAEHNLALARRDSGSVDVALQYFLRGANVADVLDIAKVDADRGGAFYGNIGRCFHIMGQIDSALICYVKSASLIDTEFRENITENQGYIRQWIGELLLQKGQKQAALHFYIAALEKWRVVSPPKAARLEKSMQADWPDGHPSINPARAEAAVIRWVNSKGGQ